MRQRDKDQFTRQNVEAHIRQTEKELADHLVDFTNQNRTISDFVSFKWLRKKAAALEALRDCLVK